ncbi:ergothioneine biosynthesis protein EgtB [Aliidiomarina soli]|uniref:Ergothioneine biosynthesis protein EgtB n=1 Tax=Aliidiomarina soli TaxID=1928574 RepID=A0A432WHA8_9GAMM|nr:ergothioneine biosynthesis protein EgtB [Aliidiomarina soli]RUO33202.1 ergothioneine biosynthesis protein EgtB [Aliidiomarina soli]
MLNYRSVREQTLALTKGLSAEDMMLQSMADASPSKWHLAHTTWFFETFLLQPHLPGYQVFNPHFRYLFNSYYDAVGERHPRPQRGLLSRPGLNEVIDYRRYVDEKMDELLATLPTSLKPVLTIGLHHEMQHQELILTDIKHALSLNPYAEGLTSASAVKRHSVTDHGYTEFDGGLVDIGHAADNGSDDNFAYDCERPQHQVYNAPFALANQLVSNRQWLQFIKDGGYQRPELWLSEGWALSQQEQWQAPLYWFKKDNQWYQFSFRGRHPVILDEPVCHVSYYEADAYARYAGARLPTEAEWEQAATAQPAKAKAQGQFLTVDTAHHPAMPVQSGLQQLFGTLWEWTHSAFLPYPGFTPAQGALAEYNSKFMINQMVLRGGSCATPAAQIRSSYRNFFHPYQRWQFSGVRLAMTLDNEV